MVEPVEQRLSVALDAQGKKDLQTCMVAVAMEREATDISVSLVIREALRRMASTVDLPVKPARKGGRA